MAIASIAFTLRRHRAIVALMIVSAALTCAVVCNTANVIAAKWQLLHADSGLDDARIVLLHSTLLSRDADPRARYREDLVALRAAGDIDAAATMGTMTFLNDMVMPLSLAPGEGQGTSASLYYGSSEQLRALGVRVVAGRSFHVDDYVPFDHGNGMGKHGVVLLSRDTAARLFGATPAVGRVVYMGGTPATVVGVTDNVLRPRPSLADPADNRLSAFVPLVPDTDAVTYVLHARDAASARDLARDASRVLASRRGERIVDRAQTLTDLRAEYFQHESTTLQLLLFGTASLLLVTLMGLAGLANYWVSQRTRSIGIRRAIGATRADILRYFLLENALVMGVGIALGAGLAFAMGAVLSSAYGVPALPWEAVAVAATGMFALGWIAVARPALSASRVSPRIAMAG